MLSIDCQLSITVVSLIAVRVVVDDDVVDQLLDDVVDQLLLPLIIYWCVD